MRDDAASIVAELLRFHRKKLRLLEQLLLSEADKLYYGRTGNIEKVIEIIDSDETVIGEIDGTIYDIARSETALAALIGIRQPRLYDTIGGDAGAGELIAVRGEVTRAMKRLLHERRELNDLLGSETTALRKSIDELSRLGRLMAAGSVDPDRF